MPQIIWLYIAVVAVAVFMVAMELARALSRAQESLAAAESSRSAGDDTMATVNRGALLPEDRLRIKIVIAVTLGSLFAVLGLTQVSNLARFSVAGGVLGALLFVVVVYASFFIPDKIFDLLHNRRLERMNRQLVEAMNVLALALRSGRTFENALPVVAEQVPYPLGEEFERAVQEIQVGGVPLEAALRRLERRVPVKDMQIFISTVLIVNAVGGSQADILDKNAQLIRERFRIKQKIHALTAEGRFSALSISLAPVFVLVVNFLMDPETVTMFVTNPIGMLILVAIGISDYIGYRVLANMASIEF